MAAVHKNREAVPPATRLECLKLACQKTGPGLSPDAVVALAELFTRYVCSGIVRPDSPGTTDLSAP
jgi:hypothetical protein